MRRVEGQTSTAVLAMNTTSRFTELLHSRGLISSKEAAEMLIQILIDTEKDIAAVDPADADSAAYIADWLQLVAKQYSDGA